MIKWQNILAVSLIVIGAVGFKWNDSIGACFQLATTDAPSNKQLASSVYDKVKRLASASEPVAIYVELVSISMLATGIIWLIKRTSGRPSDNRFVLDFSKKNKQRHL